MTGRAFTPRTPLVLSLLVSLAAPLAPAHALPPPIVFAERQVLPFTIGALRAADLVGNSGAELAGIRGEAISIAVCGGGRQFSPLLDVPMAGSALRDFAAVDLDLDGDLDLVAAQAAPPALIVRLNLGALAFAPPVSRDLPALPAWIACGDLNGDARPDVVVECAGLIASLITGSDGTLAAPVTTVAPALSPTCGTTALADVDRDGTLDLVLQEGDPGERSLFWRHGNADASFGAEHAVEGSASACQVLVRDLDGDGDDDLVVHQYDVVWYENTGAAFEAHPLPMIAPGSEGMIGVADVDGDGRLDVIASSYRHASYGQNSLVEVLYDPARATLRHAAAWHVPYAPGVLAAADFDGDGETDVATSCSSSGDGEHSYPVVPSTAVLWNDGRGALLGKLEQPLGFTSQGLRSEWALLALAPPGGGPPDVVACDYGRNVWLVNHGDGTFDSPQPLPDGWPRAAADLDGDGTDDLVLTRADTTRVLLRSPLAGGFVPRPEVHTGASYLGLADLDRDGREDLLLEAPGGGVVRRSGDGTGGFGAAEFTGATLAPQHGGIALADLDGDDAPELCVSLAGAHWPDFTDPSATSVLHVYRNDGGGGFAFLHADSLTISESGYYPGGGELRAGDVDGDGDIDLAFNRATTSSSGWFGVYLNEAGTLRHAGTPRFGGNPGGVSALADMNGDGSDDLLLHESDGIDFDFHALPALGGGEFGAWEYLYGADAVTAILARDLDGDERPDAALLSVGSHGLVVMRNGGDFAGGPTPALVALVSAQFRDGAVRLEWHSSEGAAFRARVERSDDGGAWRELATVSADGSGRVRFDDFEVTSGARYGYRLRGWDGGREELSTEQWIVVPAAVLSVRPLANPIGEALEFTLTIPAAATARVELLDLAGRRVASFALDAQFAGERRVRFPGEALAPGVYVVRATSAGRRASARFVRLR